MKKHEILSRALQSDSAAVTEGKGRNIISPPEKESLLSQYISKFKDPIIIVLLVAFGLSVLISIYEILWMGKGMAMLFEPAGVLMALLLATGIAFIFEVKANKEFDILNKVKDDRPVVVYRLFPVKKIGSKDGDEAQLMPRICRIRKQDVVAGDIVRLESGDEVPADGTILDSNSLRVDESKFTGELYAHKSWDSAAADANATYASNFLLRGSIVIDGNCLYQVTAVGDNTEEGKGVALTREGSDVETPLNQQLDQLGGMISKASFIIALLIVIGRTIYFFTTGFDAAGAFDWLHFAEFMLSSIMIAVTLIVVAVPEGLPMSVTVSLALSMRKMLKVNNLVRKLHACETMGAVRVICTDKTGTLTKNQMAVMAADFYGPNAEQIVRLNLSVNSTAELTVGKGGDPLAIGNPTEVALLKWLKDQGEDYGSYRQTVTTVSQTPFSTENKYMETTVALADGRHIRLIKGAPEIVLSMCDADAFLTDKVNTRLAEYQKKAMRTLGFACQNVVEGEDTEVRFVGVVGIADPVREDVVEAIDTCRNKAGVRVIIVTGDTPGTANEIGRQIGLLAADEAPQTVTGPDFAAMEHDEALALVQNPNFKIISRARPEDKARLVTLLQEAGEVVAVTGDGTNDAPALSKAQVGLSMGDGTSRAKEASDITIIDNSFSSINKAILWGRSLYINIRRFIIFQMTINLCACLIVLLGAFLGLETPLTVTQMLWVNLIMDTFAAMALSSLPADKRVLNDSPRDPNSHIIDRRMAWTIVVTGLVFFLSLTGIWQLMHHTDVDSMLQLIHPANIKDAISGVLSPYNPDVVFDGKDMGMFFSIFVMLQFWNIFNAKYYRTDRSFFVDLYDLVFNRKRFEEHNSWGFWIIAAVILVGQVLIVTYAGDFFSVESLSLQDWLLIIGITSPVLFVPDIVRLIHRLVSKR